MDDLVAKVMQLMDDFTNTLAPFKLDLKNLDVILETYRMMQYLDCNWHVII